MKYFVTFCATDGDVGSNPMWHSCFLLSEMDEAKNQMEVTDNWGFYGLPTTTKGFPCLKKLKLMIGLDVDLIGNHGMLRHEEVRFLDVGVGLHGTTFELTEEKYNLLKENSSKMAGDQEAAIKEAVAALGLSPKAGKARIYAYEDHSTQIYEYELKQAKKENRPSRLKPFDLRPSLGITGPSFEHAHTCKSQAIDLLSTVLTKQQIDRLTENGSHPSVPRYSGAMEKFFLHSKGPLTCHIKASGEIVSFRDGSDPRVKLYWSLPPQEIEASAHVLNRFKIDKSYCAEVKSTISIMQRLEWLFINAKVPVHLLPVKERMIKQIVKDYEGFFNIQPRELVKKNERHHHYLSSLFPTPKNTFEKDLRRKVVNAKLFFNTLYLAVTEHWEINPEGSFDYEVKRSKKPRVKMGDFNNSIEALANYLSETDKKNLCNILGKTYSESRHVSAERLELTENTMTAG